MKNKGRKWLFACVLLNIALMIVTLQVNAQDIIQPVITIDPREPGPGEIITITVKNTAGPVHGAFGDQKIYFNPSRESFKAILGIDLLTTPGSYTLNIIANGSALAYPFEIVKKEYPVQRLTLPKGMVELSPENEARVERERIKFAAIWPIETERVWEGEFQNPRAGEISTPFGVRRFMNDIPKNPHTGVDVSAAEGDEVRAPNSGIVTLIDNQYYSGNSVILDHGQGIYTMFFHLSKVLVSQGDRVKKGDPIALVGSTGRSTGAHLHWGSRVQGARVDPLSLIRLNLD